MSLVVLASTALRVVAFILSIRLLWRVRDAWTACLTLLLGLIAARQAGELLAGQRDAWSINVPESMSGVGELGGLVASVLVLLLVILVERMVTARDEAERALEASTARLHRDIAQRRRVEHDLREARRLLEQRVRERTADLEESEERFRQLADHIDAVFWLFDYTHERCIYVSPAYERIFGRPCQELYENPYAWLKALHPQDRERIRSGYVDTSQRRPFDLDCRIVHADGTIRWIRDRGFVIRDASGKVCRLAGIAYDITEKRQQAEALRHSNEELETFAQSVSHDLKAPLGAIAEFATLLIAEYADSLDERARDYLGLVAHGATRVNALLDDLLQHARLGRSISRERVELRAVVDDALRSLDGQIKEKHAEVRVEPGLPALLGHRATLAMIVQNLVSNALKFVPANVRPRITVGATSGPTYCKLFVRDNGIGIDPRHHERIFSIFERLHAAEQYPGTGIGLAIVEKAARVHDGTVTVESAPGGGATFWVTLPQPPPARRPPVLAGH